MKLIISFLLLSLTAFAQAGSEDPNGGYIPQYDTPIVFIGVGIGFNQYNASKLGGSILFAYRLNNKLHTFNFVDFLPGQRNRSNVSVFSTGLAHEIVIIKNTTVAAFGTGGMAINKSNRDGHGHPDFVYLFHLAMTLNYCQLLKLLNRI